MPGRRYASRTGSRVATLVDTVKLLRSLEPLEREGWMLAACGSTVKRGRGRDVDVLILRGNRGVFGDRQVLAERLADLGLENVRDHLNANGTPSGHGYVAETREGVRVDVGVVDWNAHP